VTIVSGQVTVTDSQGNASAAAFQFTVGEPTAGVDRELTGYQPDGFTVPAGQTWEIKGLVETPKNVVVEGILRMRPGATLRFVNVSESSYVGGGMEVLESDVGLWVIDDGILDAEGTATTSWTREPASAMGWLPSDSFVILPTAPGDERVREWRPGDAVPQAYPDVPPAEVVNLTRDVVIEGTPGGRSHVMFLMNRRPQRISFVEFRHLGPRQGASNVVGRWPLHFHHCMDDVRGSVVDGCVAHDIGSHAFVAHASNGVTFRECSVVRGIGEALWWDPPDRSNDIAFDRCLVADMDAEADPESFHRMAGWRHGDGSGCSLIGCVMAGIRGGSGTSGYVWPGQPKDPWIFRDCVSHNIRNAAFWWQNNIEGPGHVSEGFLAYNTGPFLQGAYRNHVRHTGMVLRGSFYEQHAGGVQDRVTGQLQGGERMDVDAVGRHEYALLVTGSVQSSEAPTVFTDCDFRGGTRGVVGIRANEIPREIRFVRCTTAGRELEASDFVRESGGSVVIVVEALDGSSFAVD